jgi:hypothetical protein
MSVRRRFWIEAILAAVTAVMLILTLVVPDWIEVLTGVEPDGGDGGLEWVLALGFAVGSVVFSALARLEWGRREAEGAPNGR